MPDLVIAARDASPAEKASADMICDGRTDVAVLAKALSVRRKPSGATSRPLRT